MLVGKKLLLSFLMACTLLLSVLFTSLQGNSASAAYNFGAAGDYGCGSNAQKTLNNIKSHTTVERHLALGDYSYLDTSDTPSPAQCWLNLIDSSNLKSRTRITIGNHENELDEGLNDYKSFFGVQNTVYRFSYSNARLLVMDSDSRSFSTGSSQYNTVISTLQLWSQDPNVDWIIVYLHKQMYTSPNTCGSSSCSNTGSDATNLRNTYHAKFDQYGVDVVLNGHLHNYQRTYPISYDSGSPSSPIITSTATTEYNDPTGQIFVTVGTGGINLHGLSGKASFVKTQQDDRFGALDISIENDGATLAGRYYTNDGVKRDLFKIFKSGASLYSYGPSLALSGQ
jgi:hypothetical protein